MFTITLRCDGHEHLDAGHDCVAALVSHGVCDRQEAEEAVRRLAQVAEGAGWRTDQRDGNEVIFCRGCWPSWERHKQRVRQLLGLRDEQE